MSPFPDADEDDEDEEEESACWVVYGSVIRLSGVNADDDEDDEDADDEEDEVESLLLPIYGNPMFVGLLGT